MQIKIYIPTIVLRLWKWSLLPAFALALMLTWGHGGEGESVLAQEGGGRPVANGEGGIAAHATNPDLNIGIELDADSAPCDTLPLFDDLECRIEPGASFTVRAFLDSYAGLDNAWYTSVGIGVNYSPGLTLKDRAGDTEWGPVNNRFWSDCTSVLVGVGLQVRPGQFSHGCNSSVNSTDIGKVLELDFNCPAEKSTETISLVHGINAPIWVEGALWGTQHNSDTRLASTPRGTTSLLPANHEDSPVETLVIHCDNYFPWDIDGNNAVTVADIFDVASHFGDTK